MNHHQRVLAIVVASLTLLIPTATARAPQPLLAFKTTSQASESVGAPTQGRLRRGIQLPDSGSGYRRRSRGNQYGTAETISLIRFAGARLAEAYPQTTPLLVGDISKPRGGSLPPHRSHQSGRDADIAFPERSNQKRAGFNPTLGPAGVDIEKTWFVLETLITTERVQYIFVDQRLLVPLRNEARAAGWSPEDLSHFFLIEGDKPRRGLIRKAPGHMTHFHVRFHCPHGDDDCTN